MFEGTINSGSWICDPRFEILRADIMRTDCSLTATPLSHDPLCPSHKVAPCRRAAAGAPECGACRGRDALRRRAPCDLQRCKNAFFIGLLDGRKSVFVASHRPWTNYGAPARARSAFASAGLQLCVDRSSSRILLHTYTVYIVPYLSTACGTRHMWRHSSIRCVKAHSIVFLFGSQTITGGATG